MVGPACPSQAHAVGIHRGGRGSTAESYVRVITLEVGNVSDTEE